MAMLYIFPDTNLLMHFQRIDELDWKALTGTGDIVVVLAPAVVKELGKHKDQHPIKKLRQRARKLNSWLRQMRSNEDKRLKNGVILEVATAEPLEFLESRDTHDFRVFRRPHPSAQPPPSSLPAVRTA
jgi:hypothetical protein